PSRKREIPMLAIVRTVLRLLRNEFLKANGTYFHMIWALLRKPGQCKASSQDLTGSSRRLSRPVVVEKAEQQSASDAHRVKRRDSQGAPESPHGKTFFQEDEVG